MRAENLRIIVPKKRRSNEIRIKKLRYRAEAVVEEVQSKLGRVKQKHLEKKVKKLINY